jgi:hypothetical protein
MLYKLTDQNMQTYNDTQWELGVTKHAKSGDDGLCSNKWLHSYEHPLVAVLMNPIHSNFRNPRIFEAKPGRVIKHDRQLKCGVKSLTLLREIEMPVMTIDQLIEIAIRCAKVVSNDPKWNEWADSWLNGSDRSYAAANDAYDAAADAAADASSAAYAAADAAADADAAAYAAARAYADADAAAYAAARAAYAAADAAADASSAAYAAARAAADAAAYAAYAAARAYARAIDLIAICEQVCGKWEATKC